MRFVQSYEICSESSDLSEIMKIVRNHKNCPELLDLSKIVILVLQSNFGRFFVMLFQFQATFHQIGQNLFLKSVILILLF